MGELSLGALLFNHQGLFGQVYVIGPLPGRLDLPYFTQQIAVNDVPANLSWHIRDYRDAKREQLRGVCIDLLGLPEASLHFFRQHSLLRMP